MKIVQSLWSKPSIKKEKINIAHTSNDGWGDKKYNAISWALSCLQFRKFYDDVELITDRQGYDFLINRLELPYTNVKVVLDDLNDYHSSLWALGKIYAYSLQNDTFIHADSDVYIWGRFDERIENAELLAQNKENEFEYYDKSFDSIVQNFKFIPDILLKSIENNGRIIGVNAGILGGKNTEFFKLYTRMAIDFVRDNSIYLEKVDVSVFNTIFEQFLFYALAGEKKYKIEFLLQNVNQNFDGVAELASAPYPTKYVHAVGSYKKRINTKSLLEYRLQKDYPDYYYKIIRLLRTSKI